MADDLSIEDFVLNKGALSVLFELGVEDQSFNDLKESPTILISPNTLSKRLKEAQRLGFVDKVVGEGEVRSTIDYQLTEQGENLLSQFDDIHNQYFDLKKEIAELKEEMNKKERKIRKILSEEAGKKLEEGEVRPGQDQSKEEQEPEAEEHEEADEGGTEDAVPDETEDQEEPETEEPSGTSDTSDEEPSPADEEGSGGREEEIQKLADELDLE